MKKFFVIILLAILAVSLSACSEKASYVETNDLIKEIEVIEITVVPIEVIPIEIKGL